MTIIEHVKQLSGNEAMAFAIHANAELIRTGMADGYVCIVNWDDYAIVAKHDNKVIGIITYSIQNWTNSYFVRIGYVIPKYRNKGIYKRLWGRLVEEAHSNSIKCIYGITKVENTALREVAKKLGRVEESVNLAFIVPPLQINLR